MKWNPTKGGYEKTCPMCNADFIGRKNKVYCGMTCKTKHNNDIQLKRRYADRIITEPLLRNIEILRNELSGQPGSRVTVPLERLRAYGFDDEAPRTYFIERATRKRWFRFGDYATHTDEEKQLMTITKMN